MSLDDKINRVTVKANAKNIFYDENNRLKLVFSGILPMLVFTGALVLLSSLFDGAVVLLVHYGLLGEDFSYSYLILYSLILIITFPSLWGYSYIIKKAAVGEDYMVSDVFLFYRSPLFFLKAILASIVAILPFILIGVAAYFMFVGNNMLYDYISEYEIIASLTRAIIGVVIILIILLLVIPATSMFAYIALCTDENLMVFSSVQKALKLSHKRKIEGIKFVFSFAGYMALSIITFGVIYIIFAMPYMALSYIGYVNKIVEKKTAVSTADTIIVTEEMNIINE